MCLRQTEGGSSDQMWLRSGNWDALAAKGLRAGGTGSQKKNLLSVAKYIETTFASGRLRTANAVK